MRVPAFRLFLATLAVSVGIAGPGRSQEPPAGKIQPELLAEMDEVAERMAGRLAEAPRFRVTVMLSPPASMARQAMDYRSPEGMARIQEAVDAMQRRVMSRRLDGGYEMLYRYKSLFGFSAEADRAAIEAMAELPEVERIELMPVHLKQSVESHQLTRVGEVHDLGLTGSGVVIAIIDDGIDHDHPAFGGQASFPNAKILGGRDFADDDDDPTIDCVEQSHGTAVAGVAAGNGGGILGTAPDARIVMLKVQSASLCGQPALDGDLAGAIDWVVTHRVDFGIQVLSMSLGAGGFATPDDCAASSVAISNAVIAAERSGIAVLAASGNGGRCKEISRPACLDPAISVGAVYDARMPRTIGFCVDVEACDSEVRLSCDSRRLCRDERPQADEVTCYSNSADFLDLLAPAHCATTAAAGGGTNDCFGGTSSATPFAAGVAAALLEADPDLGPDGVRAALASGVPIDDPKSGVTAPRVDALAAVQSIAPSCPPALLEETFDNGLGGWTASGLWHFEASADCPGESPSPVGVAAYRVDGECDYNVGATSGDLTSPPIAGVTAGVALAFDHARQVESFAGGMFDRTVVQVRPASGGPWTTVFELDSTTFSNPGFATVGGIPLDAFAGETILVRFRFDSVDDQANQFAGWVLGGVRVTTGPMCGMAGSG